MGNDRSRASSFSAPNRRPDQALPAVGIDAIDRSGTPMPGRAGIYGLTVLFFQIEILKSVSVGVFAVEYAQQNRFPVIT